MKKVSALAAALLLLLLAIPAFAADCENPIRAFGHPDGKTGAPLRLDWFIEGPVQAQTLSGHDLEEPIVLPTTQRSFVYVPERPGEKHMTLTVVNACGTFSRTVKYHVQQCDVAVPPITVDKPTVLRGETVTASIDPQPGHTVRWIVSNGTPSATEGESIRIVAGSFGTVRISAFVSRGNQNAQTCEGRATINVPITQPCTVNEPPTSHFPMIPRPGETFTFVAYNLGPGETVSYTVTGATVVENADGLVSVVPPSSGSFTIDYIVSKTGCSRTFSRTFEVTPCAPTATVSAGAQGCDSSTVAVDFTGTAPWQGYWNDGSYFFTWEPHMERVVYAPGTYSIDSFMDRDCFGTASGSAEVVAAAVPQPVYTIDPVVNGWYYDSRTCPGLVRTATLNAPIPAGHTLTWSIANGSIVSGQATATVQFTGDAPGSTLLTATLTSAQGCSSQYTFPYVVTMGTPQATLTVEPSAIDAGQTAIVRVTRHDYFTVGMNVVSSLGDFIVPVRQVDEFTSEYEYRSTSGPGVATITLELNNGCNVVNTVATTLTINQGAPVPATATIHQFGSDCTNYGMYAQMTGTAPFSGTWSNGQTFVSDYPYAFLYPNAPGTYTLTSFSDANGAGTVNGSATFNYTALPQPEFTYSVPMACPNSTVTATLTTPLPEGVVANWQVQGGTIVSGQGTNSIEIQVGDYVYTTVQLTGANACSPAAVWTPLPVSSYVQQPLFDLYGLYQGQSFVFSVYADQNTASLSFENSLGDPMELVDNPSPGIYNIRYTSTHGTGESFVRVYGTTNCGIAFENTRVLQVIPPPPTVTLSVAAGSCGKQLLTATFTGTAPFTATWGDTGETFTTTSNIYTRELTIGQGGGTIWVYNVYDAGGYPGEGTSIYVPYVTNPIPYASAGGSPGICVNTTHTYYMDPSSIPAGYQMIWEIEGAARIVSGDNQTVVIEGMQIGNFVLRSHLRSPEGCDGPTIDFNGRVEGEAGAPVITVPTTTVAPGQSIDVTVQYPDSYLTNTLYWAADPGTLEYVSSNWMTFTLRYTAPAEGVTSTNIRAYFGTQCSPTVKEAVVALTIAP